MVREVQEAYLKNTERTVTSHSSGHAVVPKALRPYTTQRRMSPPNMKLYLLRLAPPAHPRFKEDRLSRSIYGRWLSLRLMEKPYMKLHL